MSAPPPAAEFVAAPPIPGSPAAPENPLLSYPCHSVNGQEIVAEEIPDFTDFEESLFMELSDAHFLADMFQGLPTEPAPPSPPAATKKRQTPGDQDDTLHEPKRKRQYKRRAFPVQAGWMSKDIVSSPTNASISMATLRLAFQGEKNPGMIVDALFDLGSKIWAARLQFEKHDLSAAELQLVRTLLWKPVEHWNNRRIPYTVVLPLLVALHCQSTDTGKGTRDYRGLCNSMSEAELLQHFAKQLSLNC